MFGSLILTLLSSVMTLSGLLQFQQFISHVSTGEMTTLIQNNISSFADLDNYYQNHSYSTNIGSYSDGNTDISAFLASNEYLGYTFSSLGYHETSDASGSIPKEMKKSPYSEYVLNNAAQLANISDTYAGCGPIAMIGILDYFSDEIGYNSIIGNSSTHDFVYSVFNRCTTYDLSFFTNEPAVFMTPWDYTFAFNGSISSAGLSNTIHAYENWTVLGGKMNQYWNIITENIDKGLPVTLMTTIASGGPEFGGHYTNVYGYEVVRGVDSQNNVIERKFIKARVNFGDDPLYCDARILNDPLIGLITYNIANVGTETIHASDTANVFVNSNGGGQYFYENKFAYVPSNGNDFPTNRLRTSYIENQYLVMSPNRQRAGTAYLSIDTLAQINYLDFYAGLWGYNESISGETFVVKAFVYGEGYRTITSYDLSKIGYKNNMTHHYVLLPPNVANIRFEAVHPNPTSATNKGRICLENIRFSYSDSF